MLQRAVAQHSTVQCVLIPWDAFPIVAPQLPSMRTSVVIADADADTPALQHQGHAAVVNHEASNRLQLLGRLPVNSKILLTRKYILLGAASWRFALPGSTCPKLKN